MGRLKLAVLISGRGSNLQALIDACDEPGYPARIVRVISNVPNAAGLERARQAGLDAEAIDHRAYADRSGFEAAVGASLDGSGAELVCLAGFMRLLTPEFAARWHDRLINIHPSLLPAYRGLRTHERVIADGVRFTGCTVHFVRPEMDSGPIIVQAAVPVRPEDDAESLAARVLEAEHRCYPLAVRLIAEGRVSVTGSLVHIASAAAPGGIMTNPVEK